MNKYQKKVSQKAKKHKENCDWLADYYNSTHHLGLKGISFRQACMVVKRNIKLKIENKRKVKYGQYH